MYSMYHNIYSRIGLSNYEEVHAHAHINTYTFIAIFRRIQAFFFSVGEPTATECCHPCHALLEQKKNKQKKNDFI